MCYKQWNHQLSQQTPEIILQMANLTREEWWNPMSGFLLPNRVAIPESNRFMKSDDDKYDYVIIPYCPY